MRERRRREQELREALARAGVPDEHRAEEHGRLLVEAAFAERESATAANRVTGRIAIAAAIVVGIATLALTPAGAEVREWIADTIQPGEESAEPRLTSLPTAGSILVEAASGAWTVTEDGSKRVLGQFDLATWSPNGRFIAVADGTEVQAIDPTGGFRWSIETGSPVRALDWSTDEGFRVAYLSGGEVHVVAGDGTGDYEVARGSDVAPDWRPESDPAVAIHELAYVDSSNRVVTTATDSGTVLWRTAPFAAPVRSLLWAGDGRTLLVQAGDFASLLDGEGGPVLKGPVASSVEHAVLSPSGDQIAVVRQGARGDELALVSATGGGERRLYVSRTSSPAGPQFAAPVFSPDGEWILLPWEDADQWLFVNVQDRRVEAVADITRQFESRGRGAADFPAIAGWCCPG